MDSPYLQIADLFDFPDTHAEERERLKSKEGKNAQQSEEFGEGSMRAGDYETAVKHFKRAIEQGSTTAEIDLAAAYETGDMVPQAYRQYLKAKKAAVSPEASVGVAGMLAREGKHSEAVQELQAAVEADPSNAFLHHRLADTLRQAGFKKAAVGPGQAAIAAAADQAFYHFWLGDLFIDLGQFEEAVDALHAAVELSPGDDHVYQTSAIALWGAGKRKEAVRATRLAGDLDPDNAAHRLILEAMLAEEGEEAEPTPVPADGERSEPDAYDYDLANRILRRIGLSIEVPPEHQR